MLGAVLLCCSVLEIGRADLLCLVGRAFHSARGPQTVAGLLFLEQQLGRGPHQLSLHRRLLWLLIAGGQDTPGVVLSRWPDGH